MTGRIRLVLAIHNHQPIGNFEGVFEAAFRDGYVPFLDVLDDYPEIPVSLHVSGSLLEWIADARPEYIDRVRSLVERGQVEILGGPFYEPILAGIPRRDRVGQIAAYSEYLENTFGTKVRGMWVPERVWEQSFTDDICRAGIEYTILDDFHFRNAGLREDQLHGYFLTEDEGRLLKIFPGSEKLRYTIPFADPWETIEYLRQIAGRAPHTVVTFGDDGEKFGVWPGTKKHVYEDGWLRRFLDSLRENADWLKVCTLAEAVDELPPTGSCYLPDASYREMTEWALPADRQIEYRDLVERKKSDPDWPQLKQFIRGGFWRNFRVKYPEANEMYARMLQVSRKLEAIESAAANLLPPFARGGQGGSEGQKTLNPPQPPLSKGGSLDAAAQAELVAKARTALYRGQCNCSYWHGAFGGLYLPHLRNAVYRDLITADTLLETASGRSGRWVEIDAGDYDLDARKEIRIAGDRLVGYLAPARGGHLYELDIRTARHNLLATLSRRPEPYHEIIRQVAAQKQQGHGDQVASIHEQVSFKQPDLEKKIVYDRWPRKSLVDHFLQPGLNLATFQQGGGSIGDFAGGVYETKLRRSDRRVEVRMSREGHVGPYRVRITKTVALDVERGGTLEALYELENLPQGVPIHFGVEFNFAGMAAGQPDRYYYDAGGRQLGPLETVQVLSKLERIGLVDEWLGLDAAIESSVPADIWTFPVQTISQSEGGYELVHQSSAVVPHWEFLPAEDGRWSVKLALSIDTSAAQAKQLREAAAAR